MKLTLRGLKRSLRSMGYSYHCPNRLNYPLELRVRRMLGNGMIVEGFIGLGGDYPASHPRWAYVVLCHDWDRRANASVRQFMRPDLMEQLRAIEEVLAYGYDVPEDRRIPNQF